MYLPWSVDTLNKNFHHLQNLISCSFLPSNIENALDSNILNNTHNALESSSNCKICQLLYLLIKKYNYDISFFEDYATLCLFALYSPRCWTSTLIIASDFFELLNIYFTDYISTNQLYGPKNILAVDIQLHFFINRCFKVISPDKLLLLSNLQFIQCEFLKGCLTGNMSTQFCFKSIWLSLQPQDKNTLSENTDNSICNTKVLQAPNLEPDLAVVFSQSSLTKKSHFLHLIINIWKDSNLLSNTHKDLLDKNITSFTFETQEDSDSSQGPCLLSPTLNLNFKNNTYSVCILCECLAAHPKAHSALSFFKNDIISSMENNVKLIDRISFLIGSSDSMGYISDDLLRNIIKGCSAQEIHKHLFCDPLCAINSKIISPDILFNVPLEDKLKKTKSALATGTYLDKNSLLDCDLLHTLATIFKCIQVCKVGKTTFLEIVKEIDGHLKKHNIFVIQSLQTAQIYT